MAAPFAALESRPPVTLESLGMPALQRANRLTDRIIARMYYLALSAAVRAAGNDLGRIVGGAGARLPARDGGRLEDLSHGHG